MTPRRSAQLCRRQTASGGSSPIPSVRQSSAYPVRLAMPKCSFFFCRRENAVISEHRAPLKGRTTCKNPLSPSPFCPSWPLRAACRTQFRAVPLVPSQALPWLTSPTAIWQPALSSVVWPGPQAAPCRASATETCATKSRATKTGATKTNLTAAATGARPSTPSGPSGQTARVVLCIYADKTAYRPRTGPVQCRRD